MIESLLGSSDLEKRVAPVYARAVEYNFDDLDANHLLRIPVPQNTAVLGVAHEVLAAFAGGTPTINIGDGTTANKFVATADAVPDTAGTFALKLGGVNCKKFNSAGAIVITGSAGLTAGKGKVTIFEINYDGNGRLPGI